MEAESLQSGNNFKTFLIMTFICSKRIRKRLKKHRTLMHTYYYTIIIVRIIYFKRLNIYEENKPPSYSQALCEVFLLTPSEPARLEIMP